MSSGPAHQRRLVLGIAGASRRNVRVCIGRRLLLLVGLAIANVLGLDSRKDRIAANTQIQEEANKLPSLCLLEHTRCRAPGASLIACNARARRALASGAKKSTYQRHA